MTIPRDAYYGTQTERARQNFDVSGQFIGDFPGYVSAIVEVKKAAALANAYIGVLREPVADAICRALDGIVAGAFDRTQFPVDILSAGGGVSPNMNVNEVLANRDSLFSVQPRTPGSSGPAPSALRADREAQSINRLAAGLDPTAWQTVAFRDSDGEQVPSRFAFVRVIAAHHRHPRPPSAARGVADRRMPKTTTRRPTTGSATCRRAPNPSAWPASPDCVG